MSSISHRRLWSRQTYNGSTGLDVRPVVPYMLRLREINRRSQSICSVDGWSHERHEDEKSTMPPSLEPLDLHPNAAAATDDEISPSTLLDLLNLGLSDLEGRLSKVDMVPKQLGADIVEEGTMLIQDGLDFLDWLKSEALAHIPDIDIDLGDLSLTGLRSRLPDFQDVKSRLPEFDFDFDFDVRGRLDMVSASFEDARTCLAPLDKSLPSLADPETYLPLLRARITAIHQQLSDISNTVPQIPSLSPPQIITDLLPDFLGDAEEDSEDDTKRIDERALEIAHAIKLSGNGTRLIRFIDLPTKWKNNEYMVTGYRLISASLATLIYYGYGCHPVWLAVYIGLTIGTGIAGTVAPFQTWFDERKNKLKRIAFFLILTGCGIIPMIHMSFLKGSDKTLAYLAPVGPSILAYLTGLVFYATHFPECLFPGKFDYIGGSHAIWHVFIVIAIRIHWRAVEILQSHVGADGVCPL
ncbi:hypothetical protein FRB96_002699 [Tulasnella sp. 330]|nr:hypothetical protein FRB96_002699 [Tulasnella sp. 330]